ncbi:dipeptidyl-peptidase 2 [Plakobranchus ocellatus]|uniref:Dipeptidyl-peptidase 2 n=1 Tax=Plakobranchus ocellatus TaxID=259542 RepID=A0AAV4DMZ8_9GAST|nr:dipeptidyl-peptidase 2 [Plakobranchus ocellatus]
MMLHVHTFSNLLLVSSLMFILLPQRRLVTSTPFSAPVTSGYQISKDQAQPPQHLLLSSYSSLASSAPSSLSSTASAATSASPKSQKVAKTDPTSTPFSTPSQALTTTSRKRQNPTLRNSVDRVISSPRDKEKPSAGSNKEVGLVYPQTRDLKISPKPYSVEDDDEHNKSSPEPDDEDDDDDDDDDEDPSPEFSWPTFVIIVITIFIVLSNCAIIMVVAWTEAFSNFNKIFIYSLALADLLIGLFITPYSIFLSVYKTWIFGSEIFCNIEAYMFTTLISAKMYSLTWLNVDQYVAVRKPERYNSMMTPTRSLCWICFSWVVVISFCCPPLFSFEVKSSIFDEASYICLIDTKQQIAYVLTAGVLVCTPSMVATIVTGAYLFTKTFKKQIQFYEKMFVDLSTRPWNYHITFTMSVVFLGIWFPFSCVYTIKYFLDFEMNQNLLFVLCWLGISTGFSPFIVLFVMSPDFRRALTELIHLPEFCRGTANMAGLGSRRIETGDNPTTHYTYFPPVSSKPTTDINISSSSKSATKDAGDKRKQSRQSSLRSSPPAYYEASTSSSTSSLPYVDALGSGAQYRGSSSKSPTPV